MLTKKEQEILSILEAEAANHGVEIVTVEVTGARKSPTVRIYIDTNNGVDFDELSRSQEWINALMDKLDPFPGAYVLEVSSPGIDRPLRTPKHFIDNVGQVVVVKTTEPIDGRSNWTAKLLSANETSIVVCDEANASATVPYEKIKRAHIKGVVDFSK